MAYQSNPNVFAGKGRPRYAGTKALKHQHGKIRRIVRRGTQTVLLEKVA